MPRKNFLDDQKIFSVLKARHEQPVGCVLRARRSYADGGTTRAGALPVRGQNLSCTLTFLLIN